MCGGRLLKKHITASHHVCFFRMREEKTLSNKKSINAFENPKITKILERRCAAGRANTGVGAPVAPGRAATLENFRDFWRARPPTLRNCWGFLGIAWRYHTVGDLKPEVANLEGDFYENSNNS